MNKNMKGRGNLRRPLPIRLLAVIMAVVMVFSVIIVTNRSEKLKAEAKFVDYTGASDKAKSITSGDYQVYSPANGLKLLLNYDIVKETLGEAEEFGAFKLFKAKDDATTPKYVLEAAATDAYEEFKLLAKKKTVTKWVNGDGSEISAVDVSGIGAQYFITASSSGEVVARLRSETTYEGTSFTDKDGNALDTDAQTIVTSELANIPEDVNDSVASVTLKTYELNTISLNVSDDKKNIRLTDVDSLHTGEGVIEIAEPIKYDVSKGEVNDTLDTTEAVENFINGNTSWEGDGEYTVKKVVKIGSDTIFTNEQKIIRNVYILKSFKALSTNGDMSSRTLVVPGKVNPSKPITIEYETDAVPTKIEVDPAYLDKTTPGKIIIPADLDKNKGKIDYTVKLTHKGTEADAQEAVDSFTVTIDYGDGTPSINIANTDAYVTEKNLGINATATVDADSGADLSKINVYMLDSSGQNPLPGPKASEAVSGKSKNYTYEATLNLGYNYFVMTAESNYGKTSQRSSEYKVFYDDKAPEVTGITAAQAGHDVYGGKAEKADKSFNVPKKVTSRADLVLTLDVSDKQSDDSKGSGIDTVTVNGKKAQPNSEKATFTFTVPKNDNNDGKEITYPVVVTDIAGRSSEYTVSFRFFKEDAVITVVETPFNHTPDDFDIWDDPDNPSAYLDVTIESEVVLENIMINDGVGVVNFISKAKTSGPDAQGIYTYKCRYNFDLTKSKTGYTISLSTTNINKVVTPKTLVDIRNIDVTRPDKAIVVGTTTWAPKVVLNVSTKDVDPSSGIKEVRANGTTKSSYIPINDKFSATVVKSRDSSGTPVRFVIVDNAGNESELYSGIYYVDPDDPTVSLSVDGVSAKKVNKYLERNPVIKYTAKDDISGLADSNGKILKINGKEYDFDKNNGKKLSQIVGKVSETTSYTIEVIAKDKAGNTASTKCSFKVDGSKPVLSNTIITESVKDNGYYNKTVEIELSVSDSNISKSDISVLDEKNQPIKVKWTEEDGEYTATYKVATEGKHVVKLEAKDKTGTKSSITRKFYIDKTKPVLTTYLNSDEYEEMDEFFNSSISTFVIVDDKNEDTNYTDDNKPVVLTVTRKPFNGGEVKTAEKYGEGPHKFGNQGKYTFTYKVSDLAGNEATATIGAIIDTSAPLMNMYVKTDKPAKFSKYNNTYDNRVDKFSGKEAYQYGQYYNTDVTIELNYFEYNIDDISVYDYSSNDRMETELDPSWSKTKNGYTSGTVTISEEGYHVIRMEARDMSGNSTADKGETKTIRFTIDRTPPEVSTTFNGSGYSEGSGLIYVGGSGTVGVSVSDTNKDEDDLTRNLTINVPGGSTTTSTTKVPEGLEAFDGDAEYEVKFQAVDRAGNSSAERTVQFRVDKLPPELSITSSAGGGTATSAVTVTFNIKEPYYNDIVSSTIESFSKADGKAESKLETINFMPSSANDSMSKTYSEDGEYRFTFAAEDRTGNKANVDHSFILDGNKPIITLSGVNNYDKTDKKVELGVQVDETFYLTNKVVMTGTRTDMSGKKNSIDFEKFPAAQGKISSLIHVFNEDGIYDITIRSTDKAGNTDTKEVHFTIDTKAPVIADLKEFDGTVITSFNPDLNYDTLVSDLSVCDVKVYLDGVEYDGVNELEDGSHTLRVEAVDDLGLKTTREYTFVLDTKGPTIIVSGVENGEVFTEPRTIGVTVQLDEDTLEYVKINGQTVNVSANSSSYTVSEKGDYKLEVSARDNAGNKSSEEISFTFGSTTNWKLIAGIIGGAVGLLLLLIIIIALIARRRKA